MMSGCVRRTSSLKESVCENEKLVEITECPICNETLRDNRALPCLHTFCLKCLELYKGRKRSGQQLSCPVCRREFPIPKGGIGNLPHNFFMDKVIDIQKGGKEDATPKTCEICGSDNDRVQAISYCRDCNQQLCSTCDMHHRKIKGTATHKIVDINFACCQDEEQSESIYCDLHKKEAELFCQDCSTFICWKCKSQNHSSHSTIEMSEMAKDLRNKCQENLEVISERLSKQESKLQILTNEEKSYATNIRLQKNKLESEIQALRNRKLGIEEMRNNAKLYDLLTKTEKFLSVEVDPVEEDSTFRPTVAVERLSTPDLTSGKTRLDHEAVLEYKNTKLVSEIRNSDGRAVLGVTIHDEKMYAIVLGSKDIQVYSADNCKRLSALTVLDIKKPNDITSCDFNNCLYIWDWGTKRIVRIEIGNKNQQTHWSTGKDLGCLSITADHSVLLAGNRTNKLKEYTTDGELIRSVDLKDDIQPWHALKLSSGIFVICHGNSPKSRHRVCMVDVEGTVLKSFGDEPGTDEKHLYGPYHLALDHGGFIMVADCNNSRILVLKPDLEFHKVLNPSSTKVLRRPRRICLDSRNARLYVTDNANIGGTAKDGKIVVISLNNYEIQI